VVVTAVLTMYADFFHGFGQRIVAGKKRAAVAIASKGLLGKKLVEPTVLRAQDLRRL
jgi:hypothetical protein